MTATVALKRIESGVYAFTHNNVNYSIERNESLWEPNVVWWNVKRCYNVNGLSYGEIIYECVTLADARDRLARIVNSCSHCRAHVYNDGGVWFDHGTRQTHTCKLPLA